MDEHSRETAEAVFPPGWYAMPQAAGMALHLLLQHLLLSAPPEPCKNQPQSRKHSVSKSLKHLFHPGSKFLKTLKR